MITLAQQGLSPAVEAAAPYIFYAFAALTVLSAWAVVLSQNIVRIAIYLLLTLAGVAGLYFMLAAELLAAVQLIVYAGGTLILIIFGVMLTSRNPFSQLRPALWEVFVAPLIGLSIAGIMLWALVNTTLEYAGPLDGKYPVLVATVGKALLSVYLVPFEVAAVLLLVVMIGAAYMARRRVGDPSEGQ